MHADDMFSGRPIRYANGETKLATADLADPLGSRWFGYTRAYNNQYTWGGTSGSNADGEHSYAWFVQQQPYLFLPNANPQPLVVVLPSNDSYWFQPDGSGGYQSTATPYADRVKLTHDTVNGVYHLVVRDERFDFQDFTTRTAATQAPYTPPAGTFLRYVSPSGVQVAPAYNQDGTVATLTRTFPGSSTVHRIYSHYTTFQYYTLSTGTASVVDAAQLQISDDNGATWRPVRQVFYNYYDNTNWNHGVEGDSWQTPGALRYVSIQLPSGLPTISGVPAGVEVARTYYRYMQHMNRLKPLSLVLGPEGWRQMIAAGLDPTNPTGNARITDAQILPYADYFYGTTGDSNIGQAQFSGQGTHYRPALCLMKP